ncbi:hypothetical protein RJ639_009301 [Escallonia herrerae]|uniref:NADP-dependent oxidoreductase domain-containing protein n=1 Tax=Escallonia herrerae TaxID=1293975 RepID=A0AA88VQS3_9ASTE|nr:hypothetical protein RJ639_009301 [Escallonia herrerae]
MPVLRLGTAHYPLVGSEAVKKAVLEAIELGYRHFDTAFLYQTEQPLGEAIAEALPVAAHSSLRAVGAAGCEVLKEIAEAKGKSVAQVCLRWAYEQGVGAILVKSFRKDRMKENLEIFEWGLSPEESKKIGEAIPQSRGNRGEFFVSDDGPIKSVEELWDGEL